MGGILLAEATPKLCVALIFLSAPHRNKATHSLRVSPASGPAMLTLVTA